MKRLLFAALLLAGVVGRVYAGGDNAALVDETFSKAKTWLNEQNLSLVSTPSGGVQDDAMLGQDALLFHGEAAGNPNHGTLAQRELMAKRAAVVLAQRAASECITGTALVGSTSVKDAMAVNDDVRSAVESFLKGSQVVFQEYSKDKDMALAIIKIGVRGPRSFGATLYDKIFKTPELKKSLTELDGKPAPRYQHKVQPLEENYDGLIVDATDQSFKPALINRIFSAKNELLYDPSKVSQKVLVEQGCGEYTTSVDKAKAALGSRGIRNPLVIKATGTVSAADLQVSDQDAVTIFSANQRGNFLAGAKVAFVLK
jgi:hypothetical protein